LPGWLKNTCVILSGSSGTSQLQCFFHLPSPFPPLWGFVSRLIPGVALIVYYIIAIKMSSKKAKKNEKNNSSMIFEYKNRDNIYTCFP